MDWISGGQMDLTSGHIRGAHRVINCGTGACTENGHSTVDLALCLLLWPINCSGGCTTDAMQSNACRGLSREQGNSKAFSVDVRGAYISS